MHAFGSMPQECSEIGSSISLLLPSFYKFFVRSRMVTLNTGPASLKHPSEMRAYLGRPQSQKETFGNSC